MDPKERYNDPEEAFRTAVKGLLSGLWTALPGIINTVNATAMTVTVQPAIMAQQRLPDGTIQQIKLPLLLDVPIVFQGGGNFIATFPITAGDEALVVFSSRCIDSWWQSGNVQTQAELRMHDLSDGFAIIGPRSQPNVISGGLSTSKAQLRTLDGTTAISVESGKITLSANEVVLHAVNKITFDAGGTGFVYTPSLIDTYTDGVTSNHHYPNPPEVPT